MPKESKRTPIILALNIKSGKIIWQQDYTLKENYYLRPIIANNTIHYNDGFNLIAFDLITGAKINIRDKSTPPKNQTLKSYHIFEGNTIEVVENSGKLKIKRKG